MKKTLLIGLILVVAIFSAGNSVEAISIGITPADSTVVVGSIFVFDISISGLTSGGPPSLAAFNLDVGFDPLIISFQGCIFGNQLDLGVYGSLQDVLPDPVIGKVNVAEVSLESSDDLNNLQASSFVLASLAFNAIAQGFKSPITLSIIDLSDPDGNGLMPDLITGGTVTVTPIPEPATLALLSSGLFGLIGMRRRFTKN